MGRNLRPDARFVFGNGAHFIAFGAGSGLAPFAPGTFGTVLGWPLAWWAGALLPPWGAWVLAIALFALGTWAAERTGRDLGIVDHGGIVIDETVAFMGLLLALPRRVDMLIGAFLLFRLFDIWKPWPIRQVERAVPGGLGVMVDDLLAALYAFVPLALYEVTRHG